MGALVATGHHEVPRENRWSCLQMTLRSPLVAALDARYPVARWAKSDSRVPAGAPRAYLGQGPSVGPLGRLLQPLIYFLAQQPKVDRLGQQPGGPEFGCLSPR